MSKATDRQQLIIEQLSDRRSATVPELMAQFNVSRCTILRDIEILSCSYPIFTQQGGGGGIRVADGWYVSRRYLHDDQEALLRKLLPGLQPEDQKTMECILTAFAKPTIKEVHR